MEAEKVGDLRKVLQVFMSFALVFSFLPICAVQNAEVAFAEDPAPETESTTWEFWSSIYPDTYQAKNVQEKLDVNKLANANNGDEEKDPIKYDKDGTDFFSKLVNNIVASATSTGSGTKVFDATQSVNVTKGDDFFTSNGAGTVTSSNTDVVEITTDDNGITPKVLKGSDTEVTLTYSLGADDADGWSLKFTVAGKDAAGTDVSVEATATFDKENTQMKITSSSFVEITYPIESSTDPLLNFGTIQTIDKIVDVQQADATAVKATLVNGSAYFVIKKGELKDFAVEGLYYDGYTMNEIVNKQSTFPFRQIAIINWSNGAFHVLGKNRIDRGDASGNLNLTTASGGKLFDDPGAEYKVTVNKAQLSVKTNIDPLDYRYLDDQLEFLKTDDGLDSLIDSFTGVEEQTISGHDVIDPSSVSFVTGTYPEDGTDLASDNTSVQLTFSLNVTDSENYVLLRNGVETEGAVTITCSVKAIQDVDAPDGFIKGKRGDGEEVSPVGDVWAAEGFKIAWADHTLSNGTLPASKDGFVNQIEPTDQNNGKKTIDKIYAKDSNNVVTRIKDITFNIDNMAPFVSSMSVDTSQKSNNGIFDQLQTFFFGANKTSTVKMIVGDFKETYREQENIDAVSGFNKNEPVTITYSDAGQSQTVTANLQADTESGSAHTTDNLSFVLSGTRDVTTDTVTATFMDRAGNTATVKPTQEIGSDVMRLVMNASAPTIKLEFDNNDARNGSFFSAARTATVTITDDHFDLIQTYLPNDYLVTYNVNGNASYIYPKDFQNENGAWVWRQTFSMDADYSLFARVTNLANESASTGWRSWTIDKTKPSANVVWDNENATSGSYYSASRTATVTITEHNFDAGSWSVVPTGNAGNGSEYSAPTMDGWTHYGDTHICHVTFPGQGRYSMTIDGEDSAKNAMTTYSVSEFVVDTIQPEISISVNGEQNATTHAYADNANVSIAINDTNVDSSSEINVESISWNGSGTPYTENRSSTDTSVTVEMPNPANVPESDGVYRLTVNAKDLAGNAQTQTLDWSVNRFGSTYIVSDPTKVIVSKKYVKSSDMNDVVITEINPSGVDENSATAKVAKGTNTQTIQKGQGFQFASAGETNGWPAFSYTIAKSQYSSDAMYQTIVSSTDSAGRASDNTMAEKSSDRKNSADVSFAVDNTAPIVSFSGFDEEVVAGKSHDVNAYVEDNMKLDHATIEVNGEEVQTLSASDLSHKDHKITLAESGDVQKVTVKAYDAAGNVSSVDSASIFVNNDPIARLMHNTVLFTTLVIALVVLLGGLFWFFFIFKRRKKDEEEEQTPSVRRL